MMNRLVELQVRVMRLDKGGEQFIFIYTNEHLKELLQTLTRWAMDEELAFTWYDAARLSKEVREW